LDFILGSYEVKWWAMREPKQERREKRRAKEKARMPKHGKSLARIY